MTQNGVYEWTDPDGDGIDVALRYTSGGGAAIGTATPLVDGSASAGTSANAAAEDHRHPTDTTRAPLASPTFTGTPSLPTATVGVTQSANDSSTKLATTAFVTTADNLKANLASPTFTGTVTVPIIAGPTTFTGTATIPNIAGPTTFTGSVALTSTTTGTTQSANDNSTKISTTAYVDTGLALKANLASPAFTGTVTMATLGGTVAGSPVFSGSPSFTGTASLGTSTTGVTQTANDNSTKIATTAYADTGLALKANTASPTFTGTVTLPSNTAPYGLSSTGLRDRLLMRPIGPAAHGYKAWTCPPNDAITAFATSTGVWLGVRLYDVPALTITNLATYIQTIGTSTTLGQLSAYTVSGTVATLVATSADQHTDWNSATGVKNLAVNGGTAYTFAGGDLILGFLSVGGTSPKLMHANSFSSDTTFMNVNLSAAAGNLHVMQKSGLAATPTPTLDLTSVTAQSLIPWIAVS